MTGSSVSWVRWGALGMFLAVSLGAFGAHALKNRVSADLLAVFETGVRYQVYHALALFVVAFLAWAHPHPYIDYAGRAFLAGIVLFSGSLYVLVFTDKRWWGAITPIGGFLFLLGWVFLFLASFKSPTS
jgi:uncharacterized membrane protein YgdD (TMEM256/DUF423 family)